MNYPKPSSSQEFFDNAWDWLITRNMPRCSHPEGYDHHRHSVCEYRMRIDDDTIRTCVIGAMLPDELAYPQLTIADRGKDRKYGRSGSIITILNYDNGVMEFFEHVRNELIISIQGIHDAEPEPKATRGDELRDRILRMRAVARIHKLVTPTS